MVESSEKAVWQFLKNQTYGYHMIEEVKLLGISPRDVTTHVYNINLYMNIYSSFICMT